LRAWHADYVRRVRAGEGHVVEQIAAGTGYHKTTLKRAWHAAGLKLLNVKPQHGVKRIKDDAWIYAAHQRYMAGERAGTLEREYGTPTSLTQMFVARGLALRPASPGGRFPAAVPKTPAEIDEIVAAHLARRGNKLRKISVPPALMVDWRKWPIERRREFIAMLRDRVGDAGMPRTPHSANVEPFDAFSPRAIEIAREINAGRTSRHFRVRLNPQAQGMIWDGRLWFWTAWTRERGTAYMESGKSTEQGLEMLHRAIYERHMGPIPPSHVVRFRDGNLNNLAPENLYLQSRADEAGENSSRRWARRSRELTALLMNNSEKGKQNANHQLVKHLGTRGKGRHSPKTTHA
jgi:hypothetical protein